jgi:hypothetical protein
VFLFEGEADAIAAAMCGIAGVGAPGVGWWAGERGRQAAKRFRRFRGVGVVGDCDAEGRDFAQRAAADLAAEGIDVRVLDLSRRRSDGYDLSNFYADSGFRPDATRTVFEDLAAGAERVTSHPAVSEGSPAAVIEALRAFTHVEDEGHVLFALAIAVLARAPDGDPTWGLIVGVPSSGKTEVVRAFDDIADSRLDDVTPGGLLSWVGTARKGRRIGLLTEVKSPSFATVGDLSTLLADSDHGRRDTTYALLRRVYDGGMERTLGSTPEPLRWEGKLTLLGAATPAVDNFASHATALGARWLYYRVPELAPEAKRQASRMAREHRHRLRDARAHVRDAVGACVRSAARRLPDVQPADEHSRAIEDAALVAAYGRAAVPRSGYGAREVIGEVTREEPMRLVGDLAALLRAFMALGVEATQAQRLTVRCALDSIPQTRRGVLDALAKGAELTSAELARALGCDRKVARMAAEDLQLIGLVRAERDPYDDAEQRSHAPNPWRLDDEHAALVADAVRNAGRKVVLTITLPPEREEREDNHVRDPHTSSRPHRPSSSGIPGGGDAT